MKSEIITIGDELLIGQVINTNQAYIADKLSNIGITIERMITVGDDLEKILAAFEESWKRSEIVLVTGGLGPTHDDVTKKAVCRFFRTDLVSNEEVRRNVERLLRQRSTPWTPAAEEQTMFPRAAKVFPNRIGSAAGMLFEEPGRYFIVMPGVPYEMTAMVDETVISFLKSRVTGTVIQHLTLRTTGISESVLARNLGDIDELLGGASLAFLPSPSGVRLRITVEERDPTIARAKVREVEQRIRNKSGKYVYGTDAQELEEVVGAMLAERKLSLAVAESCTGGLIADLITNVSGSSAYFERGIIAYSDRSKVELLGVSPQLIERHGAVSKEVAEALANGIRRVANTHIGISTTGIAGPTGATEGKPVGLVWVSYSDPNETLALKFNFGDDRRRVKERTAAAALEIVRRKLLRIESG